MTDPAVTSTGPSENPVWPASADTHASQVTFKQLGLRNQLLRRLQETGHDTPTPIQREVIPHVLSGSDVLGQAATGTGKTAAFTLPILHRIGKTRAGSPLALVIAPTRELAMQVAAAARGHGRHLGIQVLAVVGGQPVHRQVKKLRAGVHVVVATPGRAVDLLNRNVLVLDDVTTVVLDEADEMMDMGFEDDLEAILAAAPTDRQTVMLSATVPQRIMHLADHHLDDPVQVTIERPTTDAGGPLISQSVMWVHKSHKRAALARLLDIEDPDSAIVFCRTRAEVDELTATMTSRGHHAQALHGGMDQRQRDRVMRRVRDGRARLLIATDVAARGLDVDALTHVINHDVPAQAEQYVHRIGRVGRAGRRGVAITMAEPRDRRKITAIERLQGEQLQVRPVPRVADLRARQLDQTVDELVDALHATPVEGAHEAVQRLLADGHEPHDVVIAAVGLVHAQRGGASDETEIPDAFEHAARDRQARHHARTIQQRKKGGHDPLPPDQQGWVQVSVGRTQGVRPADLVGAIANETGLSGSQIGPIKISQRHSRVGVPKDKVDHVIAQMRGAQVRGLQADVDEWHA